MTGVQSLEALISCVPKSVSDYCFAYGSGAVAQRNQDPSKNMADFLVVVSSARDFHRENLRSNWKHYSMMRYLGSGWIARYQTDYAARVYFNTLVKTPSGRLMKYGVIETADLITDLYDWESLYVSGRLHKPVLPIWDPEPNSELSKALMVNLKSALHAALLLLPETFSTRDLFRTVANLSYLGDFRTLVAEDRNKVMNIVDANMSGFHDLYDPLVNDFEQVYMSGNKVVQDLSIRAVYHHLELLPKGVLWRIQEKWNRDGRNRDLEEVAFAVAHNRDYRQLVDSAVRKIVFASSLKQTLKNFPTAGLKKSIVYSARKLLKMLRSIK